MPENHTAFCDGCQKKYGYRVPVSNPFVTCEIDTCSGCGANDILTPIWKLERAAAEDARRIVPADTTQAVNTRQKPIPADFLPLPYRTPPPSKRGMRQRISRLKTKKGPYTPF